MAVYGKYPEQDPLLSSLGIELLLMALNICYEDWGDYGRRIHDDPFSRLYWIVGGEGAMSFVKSGASHRLRKGRLYLAPAFSPIKLSCEKRIDIYWCHFNAKIFSGLDLFEAFPCELEVPVEQEKASEIQRMWEAMDEAFWKDKFHSRVEAEGILRQLLSWHLRSIDELAKTRSLSIYSRLKPALDHIERNFRSPIGLTELAATMGLQAHYFSNLFSESMGEAPMRYINRRRIKEAQRLLRFTEMSIKEAACACGFGSEFYFSKIFRAFLGCPPKEFREKGRLEALPGTERHPPEKR